MFPKKTKSQNKVAGIERTKVIIYKLLATKIKNLLYQLLTISKCIPIITAIGANIGNRIKGEVPGQIRKNKKGIIINARQKPVKLPVGSNWRKARQNGAQKNNPHGAR